jgi:hypothetical protein
LSKFYHANFYFFAIFFIGENRFFKELFFIFFQTTQKRFVHNVHGLGQAGCVAVSVAKLLRNLLAPSLMLCTSFCLSIRYDEKSVFFSLKIG